MKNKRLIKSNCILFLVIAFSLINACKKEKKGDENQKQGETDPTLYGTWQNTMDTFSFFEFMPDSAQSLWSLSDSPLKFRTENLIKYNLDKGSITLFGKKYDEYVVRNDTLIIKDKTSTPTYIFVKVNHNIYNRKNWFFDIKILAEFPMPRDLVACYNFNYGSMGINGDTLYYNHNSYRIMSHNPYKKEYYDSFSHYTIDYILCISPYIYWQFGKNLYKTKGFNDKFEKLDINIGDGSLSGYNAKDSTFFFNGKFNSPNMYTARIGETVKPMTNYFYILGTPDIIIWQKENTFIEMSGNQLVQTKFDGNKNKVLKNYRPIPGFPFYCKISSVNGESWIIATNENDQKRMFKVDLE